MKQLAEDYYVDIKTKKVNLEAPRVGKEVKSDNCRTPGRIGSGTAQDSITGGGTPRYFAIFGKDF